MGGARGRIHHRRHIDVGRLIFLESSPVGWLHGSRRRAAGGYLYHTGSTVLWNEYESRPDVRLGLASDDLGWTLGLFDRAPAGHAVCRRTLPVAERTTGSEVLQTPPQQRQALHLLRSKWRIRIMSDNHYDVIIIGTGAGGGTLAYHLAPSGKRLLILERGDYVPREKANWDPQVVNVDAHYNTKESWLERMARNSIRIPITTSAATPSFTVLLCSGCARKISANCVTTVAFRPLGRSAITIWN